MRITPCIINQAIRHGVKVTKQSVLVTRCHNNYRNDMPDSWPKAILADVPPIPTTNYQHVQRVNVRADSDSKPSWLRQCSVTNRDVAEDIHHIISSRPHMRTHPTGLILLVNGSN